MWRREGRTNYVLWELERTDRTLMSRPLKLMKGLSADAASKAARTAANTPAMNPMANAMMIMASMEPQVPLVTQLEAEPAIHQAENADSTESYQRAGQHREKRQNGIPGQSLKQFLETLHCSGDNNGAGLNASG